MFRGWSAIYYREMLVMRRRLPRMLPSMAVSPLLPLTHASTAIRASLLHENPGFFAYILLAVVGILFFVIAVRLVGRSRD